MIENLNMNDPRQNVELPNENERAKIIDMKKSDTDLYLNEIQSKLDSYIRLSMPIQSETIKSHEILV